MGDRHRALALAAHMIEGRTSPIYETEPVGGPPQPWYLNGVIVLDWASSPESLLARCQEVEAAAGRERRVRWGPRTLDIDVLAVGAERRSSGRLELPHPRILERAFVVRPLLDLGPRGIPLTVETLLRARRATAGQRCRMAGPWPDRALL